MLILKRKNMSKILSIIILATSLSCLSSVSAYAETTYPANEGVVTSIIDTAGYTYMELANGDKKFWIAAPTTKVKEGDHIRFVENMRMHNFTSKTLNRTFDEVIFVTSTQVEIKK